MSQFFPRRRIGVGEVTEARLVCLSFETAAAAARLPPSAFLFYAWVGFSSLALYPCIFCKTKMQNVIQIFSNLNIEKIVCVRSDLIALNYEFQLIMTDDLINPRLIKKRHGLLLV